MSLFPVRFRLDTELIKLLANIKITSEKDDSLINFIFLTRLHFPDTNNKPKIEELTSVFLLKFDYNNDYVYERISIISLS